jgi:hypothetical protein
MPRRAPLVWLAIVLPLAIVLALCAYWEPVLGDGWGHIEFHRAYPLSFAHLWFFFKYNFMFMNPRIGQTATMLLYTPGPLRVIALPVLVLGLELLLVTLALGRWPSSRRTEDALAFAVMFALTCLCVPLFGHMLFYRPYTGNYLFGWVCCCGFLVPYRLHVDGSSAPPFGGAARFGGAGPLEAPREARVWWIPAMLVLGAAAGFSNEHTTPTVIALAIAAAVYSARRDARVYVWMIAGIVGAVAGGVALYFAPGQDLRYNQLATQSSLIERVVARGAYANLRPFIEVGWHLWPAVVLLAIAWPTRRAPMEASRTRALSTRAYAAASVLVLLTLLFSPKLGQRLELASVALACVAVASWILPRLVLRWQRLLAWCAALGVELAFLVACVFTYATVGPEFRARLAALEHAPKGASLTLPPYSFGRSHWFYGDDFTIPGKRAMVATQYGVAAISLDSHRTATAVEEP